VLAEAGDIAALFPAVRPRDPILDAFARRAARAVDPRLPRVPVAAVEEGFALLDEPERRRIVASWTEPYRDRWEAMLADGGRALPMERALIAGAVRMAIADHVPPAYERFALLEGGMLRSHPADALSILVPPSAIWSIDEAVWATLLVPPASASASASESDFDRRMAALERRTPACVGGEHTERVRAAAARLRASLPVVGLPRASATAAAGCDDVRRDDAICSAIAARLLALYAMSPAVGRELRAKQHRRGAKTISK
jgi:hypothetical protein